jgi:hypothetical protein
VMEKSEFFIQSEIRHRWNYSLRAIHIAFWLWQGIKIMGSKIGTSEPFTAHPKPRHKIRPSVSGNNRICAEDPGDWF